MATACVDTDHFTTDATGRIRVKLGCGLTSDEDGIKANVAEWNSDDACATRCDQDVNATDIYCRADGQLVGPPRTRTFVLNRVATNNENQNIAPDGQQCIGFTEDILLDDWCVNAVGTLNIGGIFRVQVGAGDNFAVRLGFALDGGAFDFETVYVENGARAGIIQRSVFRPITFGNMAGDTVHELQVRICVDNNGASAIQLQAIRAEVHGMLMSRGATP